MDDDERKIRLFIPSLGALLIRAEDLKGQPLTPEEVIKIRNSTPCIMMTVADAEKIKESRGWDIDPENCWYEWQQLRVELGRSPAIDPGPKLMQLSSKDPAYKQTISDAKATLGIFRRMLPDDGTPRPNAMIKTKLTNASDSAFLWLNEVVKSGRGFTAVLFEVPPSFPEYHVGQRLAVAESDVLDWAFNDDGILSGGFSLRYQRSTLPEDERNSFDEYIGVTKYA